MNTPLFPALDPDEISTTRDALHAYAGIPGSWASTCRERRKHWWHASLRPSLSGLTSGVIYADNVKFEIELNFRQSSLSVFIATGETLSISLQGQAPQEPAKQIRDFLLTSGISETFANAVGSSNSMTDKTEFTSYSPEQANKLSQALSAVTAALETFRSGVREETSPIQLWPHHFDLSMLWLPGGKILGQDPDNEEYADRQMNFGFTFGDEGIPEPYFYITAYPLADGFSALELPDGAQWKTDGFTGAVLTYRRLLLEPNGANYLLALWNALLTVGKKNFIDN